MPFDGELKWREPPAAPKDPYERWCVIPRDAVPRKSYVPMSDLEALRHILDGIHGKWAKRFNGEDGTHCIVGWTCYCTEPTTVVDYRRAQTARLLRRLHDALPRSAQRKHTSPQLTLGKYNDAHSRAAVHRVVERAYLKLAEDLVAEANRAAHP